jgi:hypothetical protein
LEFTKIYQFLKKASNKQKYLVMLMRYASIEINLKVTECQFTICKSNSLQKFALAINLNINKFQLIAQPYKFNLIKCKINKS